jgi:hypothetical protein
MDWLMSESTFCTLTERDLRSGEERLHPVEIHDHAALDLPDQLAFDQLSVVGGRLDAVPHLDEIGALLGQDDQAVLVLGLLEEDLDLIADLDALEIRELLDRDDALGLEADVDRDFLVVDLEDASSRRSHLLRDP